MAKVEGFFKMLYLIEALLIYSVMLVSAVQQSVSDIHIYIDGKPFSIMVCHRLLNTVPCAIQQDLVVYPFSM